MARNDRVRSVFGRVEPDRVLNRAEDFGDDGVGSDFFAAALISSAKQAEQFLHTGVRAFTGSDEITDSVSPVEFSGNLADDSSARHAFILRGPRGIRRVAA